MFKQDHSNVLIRMALMTGITLLTVWPHWGHTATRQEVKEMVVKEATKQGVSPTLALAVAKVGSDYQSIAHSKQGAMGVMQLQPRTLDRMLDRFPDMRMESVERPRVNIRLGVNYLKRLLKVHGKNWETALIHYLSGLSPQRTPDGMLSEKEHETVQRMLRWEKRYRDQMTVWQGAANAQVKKLKKRVKRLKRKIQLARQQQEQIEEEDQWYPSPPRRRGGRGGFRHHPRHNFQGNQGGFGRGHRPPPPPHWNQGFGSPSQDADDFWYDSGLQNPKQADMTATNWH
ncbi:transglycosylase SLT domain-containing protein [Magnetococcus sp. PR-3]|uniref:transglycosylase SLT domain-containing protein n=1 Tax=Magnetococcus sp. PR-3 TaxID=3120355 RepID=UPI002FCE32FA